MKATVQARLDKETRAILKGLVENTGLRTSDVVRKGIHLVAREAEVNRPFRIIGLGEFDSGISDLASNKKHLEGYGKERRPASVKVRKASGR
jgi:antitoxin component of RelBE/YafQ-DinJ toxin-antitoxin module